MKTKYHRKNVRAPIRPQKCQVPSVFAIEIMADPIEHNVNLIFTEKNAVILIKIPLMRITFYIRFP